MSIEQVNKELMRMLLPEDYIKNFNIERIIERKETWEIQLYEKEELIPVQLKCKQVIKLGFCNPIELQGFPVKGKALYIKIYRRRWKDAESLEIFDNPYDFHEEGMKATREFGVFLKEDIGLTADEFSDHRRGLMH
jgi:hypothetical protein